MIECVNVVKSYNGEAVLNQVSLKVKDGEFVSIMGESGSGKSTLINILGGFLSPDFGEVKWDGESVIDMSEDRLSTLRSSKVGFVFQSFKLVSTLTAYDNIMLPLTLNGSDLKKGKEYALSLIERLGLKQVINKYPEELSGGQCQRVAIVRALSYKPKTLILDEPTGALDSVMEEKVMQLLTEINREQGVTVIQVTHSKKVADYGSRLILVKDGRIL